MTTTPEAASPLPLEGAHQRTGEAGSAVFAWECARCALPGRLK
jgi:hypothetical protein